MSIRPLRTAGPAVLLAVVSTLAPTTAAAQDEPPPDPWEVALEFGLTGASGNSSFSILRGAFGATRTQTDEYELDFRASIRYGRNEETIIADDKRASLKFDWHPEAVVSPFVFVDAVQDEIRKLDFQAAGGVGAKWTLVDRPRGAFSLSLAGLFDYQNFAVVPGSDGKASESLARLSFRAKGEKEFGTGSTFEHVFFYQPAVDSFGDYVIEITNSVSTAILENLSLDVEHLYLRDSRPAPGAARDDQRYSVVFRLAL